MTWKRVLTALVLIPAVVGIVLFTPTWVVALATAGITVLALREYFALGDAIGHRAFKIWTLFSAVLLVYAQYVIYAVNEGVDRDYSPILFDGGQLLQSVPMLFALGFAVIVLATKRPLVEVLPSAGISASALLLVAMPLSFAVRLPGNSRSRAAAAAVCAGDNLGGGYYGLFCGQGDWEASAGAAHFAEKDLGGGGWEYGGVVGGGLGI